MFPNSPSTGNKSTNPRALLPYPHPSERAKKPCKKSWRMNPSLVQSWAEFKPTKRSRPMQRGPQATPPSAEQVPGAAAGRINPAVFRPQAGAPSEGELPRTHSPESPLGSLPQLQREVFSLRRVGLSQQWGGTLLVTPSSKLTSPHPSQEQLDMVRDKLKAWLWVRLVTSQARRNQRDLGTASIWVKGRRPVL